MPHVGARSAPQPAPLHAAAQAPGSNETLARAAAAAPPTSGCLIRTMGPWAASLPPALGARPHAQMQPCVRCTPSGWVRCRAAPGWAGSSRCSGSAGRAGAHARSPAKQHDRGTGPMRGAPAPHAHAHQLLCTGAHVHLDCACYMGRTDPSRALPPCDVGPPKSCFAFQWPPTSCMECSCYPWIITIGAQS